MPAELTQAIPVIATDAPAARHRRFAIGWLISEVLIRIRSK
mgnify:CR=1 FL=1